MVQLLNYDTKVQLPNYDTKAPLLTGVTNVQWLTVGMYECIILT